MIAIPLALLLLLGLFMLLPWETVLGLYALFLTSFVFYLLLEARSIAVPEPEELAEPVDLRTELECRGRPVPDRYFDGDREAA